MPWYNGKSQGGVASPWETKRLDQQAEAGKVRKLKILAEPKFLDITRVFRF